MADERADDRPPYVPLMDRLPVGLPSPTLAEQLMDRWRYEGWETRPAASLEAIEAFERKHGAKLPRALREYLLQVNGTSRDWMDSEGYISFWSIEEMVSIVEEFPSLRESRDLKEIILADHLILSHVYTFRLGEEDPSIWFDYHIHGEQNQSSLSDTNRFMIAESFSEFVTKFVRDPWSVVA